MKPKKRQKPWDKLGISKSTFYRNKRRAGKFDLGLPNNGTPGGTRDPKVLDSRSDAVGQMQADRARQKRGQSASGWVPVSPPTQEQWLNQPSVVGERTIIYDARKAYADEMVERALVENFLENVRSSSELRGVDGRFFQISMKTARAIGNYAAVGMIKKDADRERRETAQEVEP